jgi:hypothetical protein
MHAQSIPSATPIIEVDGTQIAFHRHAEHGYIIRVIDLTRAVFAQRSDTYRRKLTDFGAVLFRGAGIPKSHPAEPDPWCLSFADAKKVLRHIADTPGMRIDWSGHAQLVLVSMQMLIPEMGHGIGAVRPSSPRIQVGAELVGECLALARRIHAAPAPIRSLALELIELRSPADAALIRDHLRRHQFTLSGLRERIVSVFGRGAGVVS